MTKKRKTNRSSNYLMVFWILAALFAGFVLGSEFEHNNEGRGKVVSAISKTMERPEPKGSGIVLSQPQSEATSGITLTKTGDVEICFTPPSGCAAVIIKHINSANESIYVQAYGITSMPIVDALLAAHKRGVRVSVLLDKSNKSDKWSKMSDLREAGIDTRIDKVSGIAHNKVMIIDRKKVITGSYNFTNSADKRNAENVIIIDDENIAHEYLQNWLSRKEKNRRRG